VKPRTVAILAVLVAALAAFLWFVDRDLPSSEERTEQAKKLLQLDPDDVTGLSVAWQGQSVRMEKSVPAKSAQGESGKEQAGSSSETGAAAASTATENGGGWRIVEPLQARADGAEIDRLLHALTGLERKRTIEDADPDAVGLDQPRGQVTLQTAGAKGQETAEEVLKVGSAVPTSDDVLVSVTPAGGAPQTFVTSSSFLDQLQRAPGDWRDKDVFTAARSAVQRLTLSSAGATAPVVLALRDDKFRIEAPVSDLAAPDHVDDLLSSLVTLRVKRFLDAPAGQAIDLAAKGLDPPRETLEADLQGGETFQLSLGAPVPGADSGSGPGKKTGTVYAQVGDQVFTASTDLPATVALPAADWRSPAWTALRSFQIEKLDVKQADHSFSLRRDGVDWLRDGDKIPYEKVNDLLSGITSARGTVVDRSAAGPGEALLTLQVTPQAGDPVTLTLYPKGAEGNHLAGSSERPSLVQLSDQTASGVLDAVSAVRDAAPEKSADDAAPDSTEEGAATGSGKGADASDS